MKNVTWYSGLYNDKCAVNAKLLMGFVITMSLYEKDSAK